MSMSRQRANLSEAKHILDCDASRRWCGKQTRVSPCLTRSRGQGLWLLSRGCRMPPDVCCRLQGIEASSLRGASSDIELRRLMGNAMTLSVVEPILRAALIATGCCQESIPDRWRSGEAQAALVVEAWGTALPKGLVALLPQHVLQRLYQLSPSSRRAQLSINRSGDGTSPESLATMTCSAGAPSSVDDLACDASLGSVMNVPSPSDSRVEAAGASEFLQPSADTLGVTLFSGNCKFHGALSHGWCFSHSGDRSVSDRTAPA